LQWLKEFLDATLGVLQAVTKPRVLVVKVRQSAFPAEPILSAPRLLFFVDFQPLLAMAGVSTGAFEGPIEPDAGSMLFTKSDTKAYS
jgi:hypothetical protein